MAYIKIWIHLVWATKRRDPLLTKDIRQTVFQHIKENAKKNNICIDFINGYSDHVHCLVSLGSGQTIEKILMLIKGESSHWINKQKLTKRKFEWQSKYFAASVSESSVNNVREYIKNQERHHKKKTFYDEYNEFIRKFNFKQLG